jgi:hypothetical protein
LGVVRTATSQMVGARKVSSLRMFRA